MTPREKKLVEAVRIALDGVMPFKSRTRLMEALAAYDEPREPPYDEYDMKPRIITEYEWPPCPFPGNGFWRAWRDGNEEAGIYGQGNTEQEAISDLEAQEDDE